MKLEKIKELFKDCAQDQRSTADQLQDLFKVAIYLKMYDAADFLFYLNPEIIKKYEWNKKHYEKRRTKHG
jgi:hypothetical protein